jgi:hypothetical protein
MNPIQFSNRKISSIVMLLLSLFISIALGSLNLQPFVNNAASSSDLPEIKK